jgi:hypothetical protein
MSRRSKAVASSRQPDLFAFAAQPALTPTPSPSASSGPVVSVDRGCARLQPSTLPATVATSTDRSRPAARELRETRIVSLEDLPDYASVDQELVDRSIAALPPGRMWFTYAAIKESFGVSRATIARKVKQGLVPGIRFRGTSVLEDGPVRRFDRNQLRWLLLALRAQR